MARGLKFWIYKVEGLYYLCSENKDANQRLCFHVCKNQVFSAYIKWTSLWENRLFAYAKTKTQISFAVTVKLISVFVFATRIVQSLYFLNPKFQASNHLMWLYSPACIGSGRKPRRPVFSERGSNDKECKILSVTWPCHMTIYNWFFAFKVHIISVLSLVPSSWPHIFLQLSLSCNWGKFSLWMY